MASFGRPLGFATAVWLSGAAAVAQPVEPESPCEAYSGSTSIFTGVAGAPVMRSVRLPDHPPVEMKLTPVAVDRVFLGPSAPVMYLTPRGVEHYATPGQTYLVYGTGYRPPDIVMASPGYGAKEIESAGDDLTFLEALTPGAAGGTITGVVDQRDPAEGWHGARTPLGSVRVRIFNDRHDTEVVTDAEGRFVAPGIPAGLYELVPRLPEGLVVWDSTSRIRALIRDRGCASVTIAAVFDGRVRGVLRGPDGQPLPWASVDLMPMDVEPDSTGHIKGTGSVSTNDKGQFEFAGRSAGRYYLGVGLYGAPNRHAASYPRTYYPGTTDRDRAVPVVVERSLTSNGFDFSIETILTKGELEVIVDRSRPGQLKVCFVQLEDLFGRGTSTEMHPGRPYREPVVEGQPYQVHVHLQYPGGHLESRPYFFTGTAGKTVVRLRPDAPRTLHP